MGNGNGGNGVGHFTADCPNKVAQLAAETGALTVGSQASRQTSGTEDRHTCAPKTFDATLSAVTSVVGWRVKFMQPSKMHGSNQVQGN